MRVRESEKLGHASYEEPNIPETTIMPIPDNGNQGGIGMWPSEVWASSLYNWAKMGLIAGLVIGVVSTILVVWMGNVKEEYLRRELGSTSERAAHAEERAANDEAGNIQLRTDLEAATAESDRRQTQLEKEQQKTALAQADAAKAQLALRQYTDEVAKRAAARELDVKTFLAALEGKPKASVRLLYNPNDSEAYMFARQIEAVLGHGQRGMSAGWDVADPQPIPPSGNTAPAAARYAGIGLINGLTMLSRNPAIEVNADPKRTNESAVDALTWALVKSIPGGIINEPDPTLSENEVVLVVGQKR